MAFPTSPSTNDVHTYGGIKYKWNGVGWQTFTGLGIGAATGGTITTDGDYKVHTFTSSGTFTVSSAPDYVHYLVVAGGGGGGGHTHGGGGGAGGYREDEEFEVSAQA